MAFEANVFHTESLPGRTEVQVLLGIEVLLGRELRLVGEVLRQRVRGPRDGLGGRADDAGSPGRLVDEDGRHLVSKKRFVMTL